MRHSEERQKQITLKLCSLQLTSQNGSIFSKKAETSHSLKTLAKFSLSEKDLKIRDGKTENLFLHKQISFLN